MKVVYIPGMLVNKEKLRKIKQVLMEENVAIEPLFSDYLSIARMNKQNIERIIMDRLDSIADYDEETHLLCHSMGCNFGVLATKHPAIHSITFISPEFRKASKKEQQEIKQIAQEKYLDEGKEDVIDRTLQEHLLLIGLFLQSRKWALKELHRIEIPIMVVYSEGDSFVSRKGVAEIGDESTPKIMLETSFHNPFLSDSAQILVKKYCHYIKGGQR